MKRLALILCLLTIPALAACDDSPSHQANGHGGSTAQPNPNEREQ